MKQSVRFSTASVTYLLSLLLLAAPFLLSEQHSFMSVLSLQIAGLATIVLSLGTNFELGFIKVIKYKELLITNTAIALFSIIVVLLIHDPAGYLLQLTLLFLLAAQQLLSYKTHFLRKRLVQARSRSTYA